VTFLLAVGAPWAVALATNLKVLPALVAVFWIGRRDWRSLAWFGGAMAVLGLVTFVLEPGGTLAYLSFLDLEQVGAVRNLSPYQLSPVIWLVMVAGLAVLALRTSRGRFGWLAAVALSVLASPRLLMYMLSTLAAGKTGPRPAGDPRPAPPDSP